MTCNLRVANYNDLENGDACAKPIDIVTPGIYDVDNTNGDQWYKFTAPKSGVGHITTAHGATEARTFSGGIDTWIKVFDGCDGELLASNDDYSGYFGMSRIADFNFEAGEQYHIQFLDQFIKDDKDYELRSFIRMILKAQERTPEL